VMNSLIIHLVFFSPALMDLVIVHMVLVQKRGRCFVSQCFGYDPYLLHHGVHFQYRRDLYLNVSTPVLR
jgi:hypothetical protein